MKISVIIVNYNGKKYLGRCLDSVLASRDPNFEIVVVENGSTDGSWLWLKTKYGSERRVKLTQTGTNKYFAGGCNWGATIASYEWLVFLNPDTVVNKDWLQQLSRQAGKNKKQLLQPKIVSAKTRGVIDNAGGKYGWPGYGQGIGRGKRDCGQYDGVRSVDFVNGTCLMINKHFFESLGGFDEFYHFFYEDLDLNLRARKQGGIPVVVGRSVITHRGGASFGQNMKSDEVVFYARRNCLLTVLKNFRGLTKWVRLVVLVISYGVLPRRGVSLRAIRAASEWGMRRMVNGVRLNEVEKRLKKKDNWLDLGCGQGELGQWGRERGWKVVEIDEKRGNKIERWRSREKFAVVSMYHVLEHVENPELVLQKIKTWLKPKGLLVIEVPVVNWLTAWWLEKDALIYLDKTHRHFLTEREWWTCLKRVGCRVKGVGATWMIVPLFLVTASWRRSIIKGIVSPGLWLFYKILNITGRNSEIVRFYCVCKR